MGRVLYTAAARKDLRDIHGYTLHEWGKQQAAKYVRGLQEKCELLARLPGMAPSLGEDSALRVALYRRHRILYRSADDTVEVLRIVHQARDFAEVLKRTGTVVEILAKKI